VRTTILLTITISLLSYGMAAGQLYYTPPVVSVPQVSDAPQLDGVLDEPAWKAAATLSNFILMGGRDVPRYPTEVRLMFDADNLYIGARMYSAPDQALKADALHRDGPVQDDDYLALVIDTQCTRQNCAVLMVNPANTHYDAFNGDATENFKWESAVKVLDDGWVAELALPFRGNVTPQPNDRWLLSVVRSAPGESEISAWCLHEAALVEPEALGTLIFAGPQLTAQIDDLGAQWLGENTAWLTVHNLAAQPAAFKLNVRVTGRNKYGHYFAALKQQLAAHSWEQFQVPYRVVQDGPGTVLFSLTDAEGRTAWRSAPYPFSTPTISEPLDQTLEEITRAWTLWGRLPEGQAKDDLRARLDQLSERWRYLDQRYSTWEHIVRPQAMAMQLEAERMLEEAKKLRAEIEAQMAAEGD